MAKLKRRSFMLLCGGAVALLSGCVDKSYDLDNFDNTAQVSVKNLTLPVELTNGIKFSSVVSDNKLVEEDKNGIYVLIQKGDFESDVIEINRIEATPDVETFESEPVDIDGVAGQAIGFDVEQYARFDFEFGFDLVDEYIRDITRAKVDFDIDFKVETDIPCIMTDLCFRMPSGMAGAVVGNHGAVEQTGSLVTFKRVSAPNGVFEFKYHVTEIDVRAAGGKFTYGANGEYGVFELKNSISLVSVNIEATQTDKGSLKASFNIGTILVNSIDGSVCYTMADIEESTNLDELPDLLKNPSTQLGLINPQLYISVTNPFAEYGAKASTNITLEQVRNSNTGFLPDSRHKVSTSQPVQIDDVYHQSFVLSASRPDEIYEPFAGAKWNNLEGLGNIVYGEGLPDYLRFIFTDPKLDSNNVHDFPIGKEVGRVYGEYAFYAPLDFVKTSQIVYTQDQSGWDMEDFMVTALEITTNVTSTIPVKVILSAYPLVKDEDGEVKVLENMPVSATEIPAGAKNLPVTIKLANGEVKGLDGIRYTVKLLAENGPGSIGPNQELELNDVRVTVSGYYDFKDEDDEENN